VGRLITTASVLEPIDVYLAEILHEFGLSASGCFEYLDPDNDRQFQAFYRMSDGAGSEYSQASDGQNTLVTQYFGTVRPTYSNGNGIGQHQISLISASTDKLMAVGNRDYAVLALEHGLKHDEIRFIQLKWTGIFSRFSNPAPVFDSSFRVWIAKTSLHISLHAPDC
jgi:hypothetical protein